MSEVEILLNEKNKLIEKLQKEIEELTQHVKDFEELAKVWKKSYGDMEMKYKVQLANAKQVIEQLEKDLMDS